MQRLNSRPLKVPLQVKRDAVVRLQQQSISKWRVCTHVNQVSQHIIIAMSGHAGNLFVLVIRHHRKQTHSLLCHMTHCFKGLLVLFHLLCVTRFVIRAMLMHSYFHNILSKYYVGDNGTPG